MLTAQRAGDRLMPEEKSGQSIVRKLAANRIRGSHGTRCRSFNLLQSGENTKSENPSDGYWEGVLELYKGRGEPRRDDLCAPICTRLEADILPCQAPHDR